MILNSFGHPTRPIVKYNTITHCPMWVDCCVVVFWLVSLRRSPKSLVLDPADVTCVHILMWIAESMEANEASQPCNTTPAPSYVVPPRIRMVWLIVVFHFLSLFPRPPPPTAHFFNLKIIRIRASMVNQMIPTHPPPMAIALHHRLIVVCAVLGEGGCH